MQADEYPEKTCELSSLVTHKRLVEAVLAGRKTQQRRNGVYGYPGERFELEGKPFEITRLVRETLGDMDDAAAQAEGYPSLEMYKDLILRMHKGMDWDPSSKVWMHEFAAVED
ncbi:MAG: ASCH domain-containing protein [Planctomycetota bacterium]|nr:ASCH domain-containing protein [Planctomycetota bacterium]